MLAPPARVRGLPASAVPFPTAQTAEPPVPVTWAGVQTVKSTVPVGDTARELADRGAARNEDPVK